MSKARRIARKIWLVVHPTHQYKEDVKMLALQNHLKIVDAQFADTYPADMIADKTPTLTSLLAERKAKQAAAEAAAAKAAEEKRLAEERAEIERKVQVEIEVRAEVEAKAAAAKAGKK